MAQRFAISAYPTWVYKVDKVGSELYRRGLLKKAYQKHECFAVFGTARNLPEDNALWREIEAFGEALANAGYCTVSGGYTGVMEAVSKGAFNAGGDTVGVILPRVFKDRPTANRYTTLSIDGGYTESSRMDIECRLASNFVVLPGNMGTFNELHTVLVNAAIERIQKPKKKRPIRIYVLDSGNMRETIETVVKSVHSNPRDIEMVTFVRSLTTILNIE